MLGQRKFNGSSSVADGKAPIVAACAKSGIMVIYVQVLQLHIAI